MQKIEDLKCNFVLLDFGYVTTDKKLIDDYLVLDK